MGGVSRSPFDSFNFGPDGDSAENLHSNLLLLLEQGKISSPPHQATQVHTTEMLWCSGSGRMHPDKEADILLTRTVDTSVAVRTADCLPVLLADPVSGVVAAAHAGWRGTAAGVVERAVEEMLTHGCRVEHLIASLGPCIGPCCFDIGGDAAMALSSCTNGAAQYVFELPLRADLAAINRLQLLNAGLLSGHIESLQHCTVCDSTHFFSYRRDHGQTGRHLAVVGITSTT